MGKIIWNVAQSKIGDQLEPITNLAFADDTGVFGNSRESASFLVSETSNNFDRIGVEINYEKSIAILIEDIRWLYK